MHKHLFSITLFLFIASSSAAYAIGNCAQNKFAQIVCAPPGGTIMINKYDDVVCGIGKCVVNKSGTILCSSQPGGAAAFDASGTPVCAGACVSASQRNCKGRK